jgi:very-short-patch-repair endonuclease
VITHAQLLGFGFSADAIKHRVGAGRLHPLMRGLYAVGRPHVTRHGRWMAAVLACGPGAALSHRSAAALLGIHTESGGPIEVCVRSSSARRRPALRVHRRPSLPPTDYTTCERIPVTTPVRTLLDLATHLTAPELESAVNAADRRDLVDPESLRSELEHHAGQAGVAALRALLHHSTFTLTDSELERRLLPIARRAGLPLPQTRRRLNGFLVDFYWPDLGLVVETDGLRYHRTPAQQARDRVRDQAHTAAGLTPLRFTHAQVRYEPEMVLLTLAAVASRLCGGKVGAADERGQSPRA